jgi:PIN domain nuclease of toxin-antitoxin system
MKAVLDTHILLYYVNGSKMPSGIKKSLKEATDLIVSAISSWEIFMLCKKGYIELSIPPLQWYKLALLNHSVREVSLSPEISYDAVHLEWKLKDSADRWIVATAIREDAMFLTKDKNIQKVNLVKTVSNWK